MVTRNRSSITGGVLLILLGLFFFVFQVAPGLWGWFNPETSWALIIVGIAVVFLVAAVAGSTPGLAIPAAVLGGIGSLLYWQNATGNWDSWAYCWTLIPGFVGVGLVVSGLLGDTQHRRIESGLTLILVSGIMFALLASLFGVLGSWGVYWPLLLIFFGLLLLIRPMFRFR